MLFIDKITNYFTHLFFYILLVDQKKQILFQYLPELAIDEIVLLQEKYVFHLKISKPRNSKLGDFRPIGKRNSRISVNGNLNKYEFLIVLLHEIAHLLVWKNYGLRTKPHGKEWQFEFKLLLKQYIVVALIYNNSTIKIKLCIVRSGRNT